MNNIRTLIIILFSTLLFNNINGEEYFTLPFSESWEQKIIAYMATFPEWEGELQSAPNFEEYLQSFKAQGYTILHDKMERKLVIFNLSPKFEFYLEDLRYRYATPPLALNTPTEMKTWIEEVVIPPLNLPPSRHEAFIKDFLSHISPTFPVLIYRQLILKVAREPG